MLLGDDRSRPLDGPGLRRPQGRIRQSPGGAELAARHGRAERGGDRLGRPLELGRPARGCGTGDEGAADPVHGPGQGVGGQAAGDSVEVGLRHRQGRCAAGQPPAGGLRRDPQIRLIGRRVPQQESEQLASAALPLALLLALRLGVALDRVGRELIDVGEDRLGEHGELVRIDVAAPRRGRDSPPRHPSADAVGGLQRVEGAALPQLAASEAHVDVAARLPPRVGIADQGDELAQRLGDPGADAGAERPLQRPGVLGHLAGDRGQDLLGGLGELGLDRFGELGRQRAPWLAIEALLSSE